ncbi:MAG: TonB-dependent receptor [Sulfuricurvum sp.]|nr:TonB-dependent receptor [Sulfuricurvum sp.]
MIYRLFIPSLLLSFSYAQETVSMETIQVEANATAAIESRKENSISKRIVTGSQLTQYGDLNVLEILKRTAGVTIPDGTKKGAVGKGYTKVLVDGEEVSTSSRHRGSVLEQISPDMIERMEVMSNGSAEYTAEAMGGIVNIILKKPKSDGKAVIRLTGGMYHDSPMGTAFASYEKKEGKLSYLVSTTSSDTQRDDAYTNDSNGTIQSSDEEGRFRFLNLNTKLIYTADTKNKYTFDTVLGTSKENSTIHDVTTASGTVSKNINETDKNDGIFYMAKALGEHHISQSTLADWKLILHGREQEGEKNSRDAVSLNTLHQKDDSLFRVYGVNTNLSYLYDQHFFKGGVEYRHMSQRDDIRNDVNATQTSNSVSMDQDRYALYVQDEMSLGDTVILTSGVRYEKTSRDVGNIDSIDYVAPSLHMLYKITPDDQLRLSVAKSVKLPRLDEISSTVDSSLGDNDINNPDITGNPNLKEETAIGYEMRLEHYFSDKGIVSLNTFYRDMKNKIEKWTRFEGTRYVQKPENSGEAQLWGTELEVKKQLGEWVEGLGIWGNATVQKTALQNTASGFSGVIAQTPLYLLNFGADYTYAPYGLGYGAAYRYNGGFDDPIDQSFIVKSQNRYGVLDVYVTKRLDSTFKLSLNLKNITREPIETTSSRYDTSGSLIQIQRDKESSRSSVLLTLDGKW